MTHEDLWKAALGQVELSISKANFITWFKNTSILSFDRGVVTIAVPNGFAKEWLENKYNLYILRALKSLDSGVQEIRCNITQNDITKQNIDSVKRSVAENRLSPGSPDHSTAYFTRKKIANQVSFPRNKASNGVFESHLNPRYSFENFIVAENNELARAACFAVSQNLGHLYNPLFIYGGVGLGKTHLLQALGNEIMLKHSEKRVKYITSERFTAELVDSIKNQTADQFKRAYEEIDLLIIDDVQFLAGREKTQQEFFHIFNALYQLNKQIVISSDRPPKAIPTLEERLQSRFEGGMIADISKPNLETRIAILETKIRERNINLDGESVRFIAEHITQNIRELEGALARVTAYGDLHHIPLNVALVKRVLADLIVQSKRTVRHEDILKAVSEFYGVSETDLVKKGRKKEVAHPRQIAMYLMRTELDTPLSSIGSFFGGRDHTTVLHAVEKIEKNKESSLRVREELVGLQEKLRG